jgi:hypothetical protein
LFVDGMGTVIPTRCLQLRDYELPAGIGLVHTQTSKPGYKRPSAGQRLVKETGLFGTSNSLVLQLFRLPLVFGAYNLQD